jgi:hypothetical protein
VSPHLRADGEHVAEALVGDQGGAGQAALDDRVGGDGGAVGQVADVGGLGAGPLQQLAQAVHEAGLDPLRRRAHLGDANVAVVDHDHGVGERPADINPDPTALVAHRRDATTAEPVRQSVDRRTWRVRCRCVPAAGGTVCRPVAAGMGSERRTWKLAFM